MTATQSFKIYELLNAQFQQPEKTYETLLHKDLEILRKEIAAQMASSELKRSEMKSELTKTIYIVGFSQFIAIVGSILAIVLVFIKK